MSCAAEKLADLLALGQSLWLDDIDRGMFASGDLRRMIVDLGVRGLTSNPAIFDAALRDTELYDSQVASLASKGLSAEEILERVMVDDVVEAAEAFLGLYKESGGRDGFVSIEISPLLASDYEKTVEEALRYNRLLGRPNVMIKIPATPEGVRAMGTLLEEGVNVNATLLFSADDYLSVARAYIEALEKRRSKGLPIDSVSSVASFFVSRADSVVDKYLTEIINESRESASSRVELSQFLLGKFAVANASVAYGHFLDLFSSDTFKSLKAEGASVQRLLWASTSTKNPAYSDVKYVEELIATSTVNTLPHKTLMAFLDHGTAKLAIGASVEDASGTLASSREVFSQFSELGLDIKRILKLLQVDGLKSFSDSYQALLERVGGKRVP